MSRILWWTSTERQLYIIKKALAFLKGYSPQEEIPQHEIEELINRIKVDFKHEQNNQG